MPNIYCNKCKRRAWVLDEKIEYCVACYKEVYK